MLVDAGLLLIIFTLFYTSTFFTFFLFLGLICWECEDAYGQAQCLRKGRAVRCESNQVHTFKDFRQIMKMQ